MDQHLLKSTSQFTIEICIDNLESAKAAIDGGADRLEVCSSLALGGLTPSKGLLIAIKSYLLEKSKNVHLATMIRPRPGDFIYSQDDIDVMVSDIQVLSSDSDSFVFGCLQVNDNLVTLNDQHCDILLKACENKPATFHRAIDVCTDLESTCKNLIRLGFKRILTSGGAKTALEGISKLGQLESSFGQDIVIMAGSGVNASNMPQLYQATKIMNYHSSCSIYHISPIEKICGHIFPSGVAKWQITDTNKVHDMRQQLKEIEIDP